MDDLEEIYNEIYKVSQEKNDDINNKDLKKQAKRFKSRSKP